MAMPTKTKNAFRGVEWSGVEYTTCNSKAEPRKLLHYDITTLHNKKKRYSVRHGAADATNNQARPQQVWKDMEYHVEGCFLLDIQKCFPPPGAAKSEPQPVLEGKTDNIEGFFRLGQRTSQKTYTKHTHRHVTRTSAHTRTCGHTEISIERAGNRIPTPCAVLFSPNKHSNMGHTTTTTIHDAMNRVTFLHPNREY